MNFLRSNTAVIVAVGPFYDKTDGVTIETALTITNERITLTADTDAGSAPTNILDNVTGATSGTNNDLNYITGNDAGMMQLELAAADTNRVGRMFLSITDAANHVPVFHTYFVLPQPIFDWLTGVIVPLPANMTQILGTAVSTPTVAGVPNVNVKTWNDLTTVALPLVPTTAGRTLDVTAANKVNGVVLVDTLTTYTGNTLQTGDSFARLGAPAGASVSVDIAAIEAQTDDIGAAGAGLTAVPWNAAWDAEVQSEVDDALVVQRLDELVNADSDIDGAAPPTVGSVFHELMSKTAGSFTFDQTTDSNEAIRDKETDIETDTAEIGTAGAGLTAIDLPNQTMDIVGNITGNLSGSVGSVTGAVGSVTGLTAATVHADLDDIQARLPAALSAGGNIKADVLSLGGVVQSLTDLKDFADDGYDPVTNKVQGVVLVDTLTTYTGNTPQTGDVFPLASTEIADIKAKTDLIPAAPASTTNITAGTITTVTNLTNAPTSGDLTATMKASVNTEVDTAIADARLDELLAADSDIDGAAPPTVGSVFHELLTKTPGSFTYDQTTDSLEALKDGASAPTVGQIADAVWDETLSGHLGVGSTGEALNAAGSAGDPWVTALPGAYGAGSAGKIVGDNLNATISSRSSHSAADVWAAATRLLTAGTNIVLAKGVGVTGFNDLSAAQVNTEADTALTDYDGPTNAELATALGTADDAVLAAVAALNNLSQANVRTAVGLASANLDTQLGDLPTNAELATALGTADDAVLAAIAALNNLAAGAAMTLTSGERTAIANALLDLADTIEVGLTLRNAQRLQSSAAAGKLSGAATTTAVLRNAIADSKDRITATVDADGNRSAVTVDLT